MKGSRHENQNFVLVRHFLYFFRKIRRYKFNEKIIFFFAENRVSFVKKILKNLRGFFKFKKITFLVNVVKNFLRFKKNSEHLVNRRFFERKNFLQIYRINYFGMNS